MFITNEDILICIKDPNKVILRGINSLKSSKISDYHLKIGNVKNLFLDLKI